MRLEVEGRHLSPARVDVKSVWSNTPFIQRRWGYIAVSSVQALQLNIYAHLSSLPPLLPAQAISFSLISLFLRGTERTGDMDRDKRNYEM